MRRSLLTLRRIEALGSDQIWPGLVGLTLFITVEVVAELCRRHFADSMELGLGWATSPLQAALAMMWAYVAHQRLAFRGWTPIGKLPGAAIFVVVSLGCLESEFVMRRLAPGLDMGVWVLASGAKFGLVYRLVWPVRPAGVGLSA